MLVGSLDDVVCSCVWNTACQYSLRQSCVAVLRFDFEEWERLIGRPFGSRCLGLDAQAPFLIDHQRFDGIRVVVCKRCSFISPLRVLALPLLVMATPVDNVRIENALVDSEEAQGREKIQRIDSSMDTTGGAASSTGVLQNGGGSEVTNGQGVDPVSAVLVGPVGPEIQRHRAIAYLRRRAKQWGRRPERNGPTCGRVA